MAFPLIARALIARAVKIRALRSVLRGTPSVNVEFQADPKGKWKRAMRGFEKKMLAKVYPRITEIEAAQACKEASKTVHPGARGGFAKCARQLGARGVTLTTRAKNSPRVKASRAYKARGKRGARIRVFHLTYPPNAVERQFAKAVRRSRPDAERAVERYLQRNGY